MSYSYSISNSEKKNISLCYFNSLKYNDRCKIFLEKYNCDFDLRYNIDLSYITLTEYQNNKKNGFEMKLFIGDIRTYEKFYTISTLYEHCIRFIFGGNRIANSDMLLYSVKRYKDDIIDVDFNESLYLNFVEGLCQGRYTEDIYLSYSGYDLTYEDGELKTGRYTLKRVKAEENIFSVINGVYSRYDYIKKGYTVYFDIGDNIIIERTYSTNSSYNTAFNDNLKDILKNQSIIHSISDNGITIKNLDETFILKLNTNRHISDVNKFYTDFIVWLFNSTSEYKYDIKYLKIMNVNTSIRKQYYTIYFVNGLLNCDMIQNTYKDCNNFIGDRDIILNNENSFRKISRYRNGELKIQIDFDFLFKIVNKYLPIFDFVKRDTYIHCNDININVIYGDQEDTYRKLYVNKDMSENEIKIKFKRLIMNKIYM